MRERLTARQHEALNLQFKKYDLGKNACRNCQAFRHTKCRIRLDGTLCSCSCEHAELLRGTHEDLSKLSVKQGGPELAPNESLSILFPRVCELSKNS